MSVTKAVRFRYLTSQLTQIELNAFVTKMLQTKQDFILRLLFKHFATSSSNHDEVNAVNKSLSTIIQSRKQQSKPKQPINKKLDEIPKSVIGHIASFLKQTDYINFSKINRFIHLGCNAPNSLQTLDLQQIKDYSAIKWNQYSSIKNLKINIDLLPHIPQFADPIFNRVQELTLNAQKQHGFIDDFLSKNIINPHNITTLKCVEFGSIHPSNDMPKDEFLRLLTKCPNIQHMYLYALSLTDDVTATEIADLCPNIVGLRVDGGSRRLNDNLVRIIGDKLKGLNIFHTLKSDYFNVDDTDFNKMEQLGMIRPSNQSFAGILKTATNLKQIFVQFASKDTTFMSNDEIKNMITNLIIKCESLEYLSFIASPSNFGSVLDGIEGGLFKTKQRHRTKMKILIDMKNPLNAKGFTVNVARIIYLMKTSKITDFMFIWKIRSNLDINDVNEIEKDLNDIILGIKVIYNGWCFIVTNEHCTINGCRESWFMYY